MLLNKACKDGINIAAVQGESPQAEAVRRLLKDCQLLFAVRGSRIDQARQGPWLSELIVQQLQPGNASSAQTTLQEVTEAASTMGLQIQILNATTSSEAALRGRGFGGLEVDE